MENTFLHLKRWRGIATRYAKRASSFLAVIQIRCIALWAGISWRHYLGGPLSKSVALVLEALTNLQLEGVKDHLLFEVRRTEFRGASPETRILAEGTTAADFFAYFLTPKSRAPLAKRSSFFASFWGEIILFFRFFLLFWRKVLMQIYLHT